MPDIRPVLGAVVFFLIIGIVGFFAYHFLLIKPRTEKLETERTSALSEVGSLYTNLNTPQAISARQEYSSGITSAKTPEEIQQILADARAVASRERKRQELLARVDEAANGMYHSSQDAPELSYAASILKDQINSKTTLAELQALEPTINQEMTSAWRNYFSRRLEELENSKRVWLVVEGKSWLSMSIENAAEYIQSKSWTDLKKLDITSTTLVEVPVQDIFSRTPNVRPGKLVNIYLYDPSSRQTTLLVGNARILGAVYPQEVLSSISWSYSTDTTSYSYTTDVWETIKARMAGSTQAAAVSIDNFANRVIDSGLNAALGMYQLSVIYRVEVPEEAGRIIVQCELHETSKDIILVPVL